MRFNGIYHNNGKILILAQAENIPGGTPPGGTPTTAPAKKDPNVNIQNNNKKSTVSGITLPAAATIAAASGITSAALAGILAKNAATSSIEVQNALATLQLHPGLLEYFNKHSALINTPGFHGILSNPSFASLFNDKTLLGAIQNNPNAQALFANGNMNGLMGNANFQSIISGAPIALPIIPNIPSAPIPSLFDNVEFIKIIGTTNAELLQKTLTPDQWTAISNPGFFTQNTPSVATLSSLGIDQSVHTILQNTALNNVNFFTRNLAAGGQLSLAQIMSTPGLADIANNPNLATILNNKDLTALTNNANFQTLLVNPKFTEFLLPPSDLTSVMNNPSVLAALDPEILKIINGNPEILAILQKPEMQNLLADQTMLDLISNQGFVTLMADPNAAALLANPQFLELVKNPEFLKLLNDPVMQELLSNPEIAKIMMDPKFMELMQQGGLQDLLSNKDLLESMMAKPELLDQLLTNPSLAIMKDNPTLLQDVSKHASSPVAIALYSMIGVCLLACLIVVLMKAMKKEKETITPEELTSALTKTEGKMNDTIESVLKEAAEMAIRMTSAEAFNKLSTQNKTAFNQFSEKLQNEVEVSLKEGKLNLKNDLGVSLLYTILAKESKLKNDFTILVDNFNIIQSNNVINERFLTEDLNTMVANFTNFTENLPENFKEAFKPVIDATQRLITKNKEFDQNHDNLSQVEENNALKPIQDELKEVIKDFSNSEEFKTIGSVLNLQSVQDAANTPKIPAAN